MPSLQLLQLTDRGRGLLASRRSVVSDHSLISLQVPSFHFPLPAVLPNCSVRAFVSSPSSRLFVRNQPGGRSPLSPARCLPVELWRMPARARAGGGGVPRLITVVKPVHWPPMGMVPAVDWLQQSRKGVASNLCISSLLSYSRRLVPVARASFSAWY
jgi:hypothetical protein